MSPAEVYLFKWLPIPTRVSNETEREQPLSHTADAVQQRDTTESLDRFHPGGFTPVHLHDALSLAARRRHALTAFGFSA